MPILSTVSYAKGLFSIIASCVIIVAIIIWHYTQNSNLVRQYLHQRAKRVYFCGYTIEQMLRQDFLHNLERFLDLDLSAMYATLMMTLLHDNRNARFVSCIFNDAGYPYRHSWVEFRYLGVWYVLDPDWYESVEVTRRKLNRNNEIGAEEICPAAKYWKMPICEQIYRKLSNQDTSHLFFELYSIACGHTSFTDVPDFEEGHGRTFVPLWLNGDRIITQSIVDFLMSSRDYSAPPQDLILAAINQESHYRCRTGF